MIITIIVVVVVSVIIMIIITITHFVAPISIHEATIDFN